MIEYQRDLSLFPDLAMTAYFCSQMNVRKRQLVCEMSNSQVTIQAGSMQWMLGNVNGPQPVLKRRRRSFWQGYPRQSYRGIRYQT